MPRSRASLRSLTDLSSSTSPHQPVETVHTPKPTSETAISVPPRLRYLIFCLCFHSDSDPTQNNYYIVSSAAVDFLSLRVLPYNRAMLERPGARAVLARYSGGERGTRTAARAGSVVVIVDAFRASTSIAVLVWKGARVFPVASIEEAAYAGTDFRIGERGSAKVAGFDFGNSPTEILASEIPPDSTV